MVYFPLALLTTTALVAPDLLCFLRTYMEQRHSFFACATQSHPIFWCNSLIFSIRDVMAQKVMKSGNKFEHLLMSMPANEPFMRCAYMEKGGSHSKSLNKLASANCRTTVSQLPYDRIPIAVRWLGADFVMTSPEVVWKETVWKVSNPSKVYVGVQNYFIQVLQVDKIERSNLKQKGIEVTPDFVNAPPKL